MEYKAIYKCRLCGKTYRSTTPGGTANREKAEACMVQFNAGICGIILPSPTMTETHHCGGGAMGLADFQGWKTLPPGSTE